jgi:hypothetical protein
LRALNRWSHIVGKHPNINSSRVFFKAIEGSLLKSEERGESNIKAYQLETGDNTSVFRTGSFSSEGRSVLHSGIYNRELSSSLAAGAAVLVFGLFFARYFEISAVFFMVTIVLFAVLFVLFRIYIFREPALEAVFDGGKKIVTVSVRKSIRNVVRSYSMGKLSGITLDHITVQPQNIDGVEFVEKIALQHGTVIPGFGKKEDFYTVSLDFQGEKVVIFSTRDKQSAEAAASELRKYVNNPDTGGKGA